MTTPSTVVCAAALMATLPALSGAQPPSAAAAAAWDAHVTKTEAQLEAELTQGLPFGDATSAARAAVERGDVAVNRVGDAPIDVPGGLLHHWRGRVLVRGVSLERLLLVVRDPGSHVQEDVLEARLLHRAGDVDRVFLKIRRSSLVTAAYNTEHLVTYRTRRATLVTSRSEATKIAELQRLGTPEERERSPSDDRGFLWRMNAYWRYESVPDGILITLDSLTMSRSIPWALSPLASPIVNRVARESVGRTLRSLQARFVQRILPKSSGPS